MAVSRTNPAALRFERFALAVGRWSPRWAVLSAVGAAYVTISLLQSHPFVYLFVLAPALLIALELAFDFVDRLEHSLPRGRQEVRETAAEVLTAFLLKLDSRKPTAHAGIDQDDIRHFQRFDPAHRARILQVIMARSPSRTTVVHETNGFERVVQRLHREGFGLIDLQRQDAAFTSVWYRKSRGMRLIGGGAAAMLVWEMGEETASTTVIDWTI